MQNFKFGGVTVLAVQLINKIWKKKKKKDKEHEKKHVSLYFPDVMSKYIFLVEFIPFCMFFTLMSLEMEIT